MKVSLPLAIVALYLFGQTLNHYYGIEAALFQTQLMLLACIAAWCGIFLFLTFSPNDLVLIGLLLIAISAYFIGYVASQSAMNAIIFLASVTLGRGALFFFENRKSEIGNFLIGLVVLLAFSSWWRLNTSENFYPAGVRWTGLWDNPNDYGMLMSTGTLLVIGLLAVSPKSKVQCPKFSASLTLPGGTPILRFILFIAAFMMSVGLFFSYSRGSWLGTAIGLLYLAKAYGKFKWRYVASGIGLVAVGILLFWNRTPDSSPWYMKRMDFGRPSAQHRVAAWKAGFEIMRDHPFGVGWNNAISTYGKRYSPPEGGAAAITTNDYLMLGTQLGIPTLLCFVTYAVLQLGIKRWPIRAGKWKLEGDTERIEDCNSEFGIKTACRAAAIAMLVEFWFDGGLFKLATASVFWILLELGAPERKRKFVKERKPQAAPAL